MEKIEKGEGRGKLIPLEFVNRQPPVKKISKEKKETVMHMCAFH
jgi:hypothetical protein